MASCDAVATCDIEVDVSTLKQQRAKLRLRHIATKSAEYQRARFGPRSRSSVPADRVKPHRIARTVTRGFLAKGLVQSDADMPSITSVDRSTSAHARKKPSVAAMVSCGANLFLESSGSPLNECSDAEVAAVLGKSLKNLDVRIPGLSPPTQKVECEAECKPVIAKATSQKQAEPETEEQEPRAEQAEDNGDQACNALAVVGPGLDICAFKMRRAEARKRHMAAKRVDFQRARTTPRARSSDPADRVKPHRIARTAARTFVAKGVVEGESDMPSLTSMGKRASVHARKKPSVAPLVQLGFAPCLGKSIFPPTDSSDFETTASEGENASKAHIALRAEVASDSDSGSESKLGREERGSQELETPRLDEQEQPRQQEPEQRPTQNEARVEREFVGRILDFELREAEGVDEQMGGPSNAEPEPVEQGWEVLPQAEALVADGRGASRRWWNIFF